MALRRYQLEVTTPDLTPEEIEKVEAEEITGEGEASGKTVAPLRGICEVKQVTVRGAPEGTKVAVEDLVSGVTILSASGGTDKTYRPVIAANAAVGGAESKISEVSLIAERVQFSISESDPGTTAKIDLVVREG